MIDINIAVKAAATARQPIQRAMRGDSPGNVGRLSERDRENPGIGDTPLLPAPKDPSKCVSRSLVRDWWEKAQGLGGLEPKRGRGWHSLRRKFASDLMDQPLKVVVRARRLENRTDGATVLPAGRRGTAQEGSGEPTQSSRERPGLSAAYTLKKRGIEPILFETRDRVGGRLAGDGVNGFLGAASCSVRVLTYDKRSYRR